MRRRTLISGLFTLVAAAGVFVLVGTGYAAPGTGQDDFIRSVGREAIDSLTDKKLTDQERQERFRVILRRTFELPLIARFTLGRFWRRTTPEQRKEYLGLFEDFIVQAYAVRFRDYSGETFSVSKVREINDTDVMVFSDIALKDGRKIVVYWRVRGKDHFKIIDVIVEGVSMVITQRDEFSAIISQNGGTVDSLLVALREKTAKKPL